MIEYAELSHYISIALIIAANAIGVGIGQGLASKGALKAIDIQPSAQGAIFKSMILGSALMETAAILASVLVLFLLLSTYEYTHSTYTAIALYGILAALAIPGFCIGIFSSYAITNSALAIARQPLFSSQIIRFMLICQSIMQTPVIFGFIIAMFIKNQLPLPSSLGNALRMCGAGVSIGFGSIGPIIGLGIFAQAATRGLGINRHSYHALLPFSFASQAIIETPTLLALVMSLILLIFGSSETIISSVAGIAMLSAGLCIGIGTIAPGISSGLTSAAAALQIARNPSSLSVLSRTSIFAQGIIDTTAIYMFLISMALFFISRSL